MKLINLESVGTGLAKDGMTYPMLVDGGYDYDNGVHMTEVNEEWWDRLSGDDTTFLATLRIYRPREIQSCCVLCICGGRAEMSASLGPSCPDCYDRLSG